MTWEALRSQVDLGESGHLWVAQLRAAYGLDPPRPSDVDAIADTLADLAYASMTRHERRALSTGAFTCDEKRVHTWVAALEDDVWRDLGRPTPTPVRLPVGIGDLLVRRFSVAGRAADSATPPGPEGT